MKNYAEYEKELNHIQSQFNETCKELAEKLHAEVIIPMCNKHKIHFISGIEEAFFISKNKDGLKFILDINEVTEDDELNKDLKELSIIFELLKVYELRKHLKDYFG